MKVNARKELAKLIFIGKYAQWNEGEGRRETHDEAIDRTVNYLEGRRFLPAGQYEEIRKAMKSHKILSSQRMLQFAGDGHWRNEARGYNCAATYCNRIEAFSEAAFALLSGTGVGMSVQRIHTDMLPRFAKPTNLMPRIHRVADSIEGWADSVLAQIENAVDGHDTMFIYDNVRPKGSVISSTMGRAPGPEPLRQSHNQLRVLLREVMGRGYMRPIDAADALCIISECVRAGGIRRSAMLIQFDANDEEMLNAKTGDWFTAHPYRARSNNSAVILRRGGVDHLGHTWEETPKHVFDEIFLRAKETGDPGYLFLESPWHLFNPCVEASLYGVWIDGDDVQYGWQFCNLTSINLSLCDTTEDLVEAAVLAARLGTIQASFTDFRYFGEATQLITEREALLGVSFTGWAESAWGAVEKTPHLWGPSFTAAAKAAVRENRRVAELLNIQPAARVTNVKPEGTGSLLLETSSGISRGPRRYIRAMTASDAPEFLHFFDANPDARVSAFGATYALFPLDTKRTDGSRSHIDALKLIAAIMEYWVRPGNSAALSADEGLLHNVSNTVYVEGGDEAWQEASDFIWQNRHSYSGIALFSTSSAYAFPVAPETPVPSRAEVLKLTNGDGMAAEFIETAVVSTMAENLPRYDVVNNVMFNALMRAACPHQALPNNAKELFNMIHSQIWFEMLARNFKEVDYSTMVEPDGPVSVAGESVACAGGACEI